MTNRQVLDNASRFSEQARRAAAQLTLVPWRTESILPRFMDFRLASGPQYAENRSRCDSGIGDDYPRDFIFNHSPRSFHGRRSSDLQKAAALSAGSSVRAA